MSWGISIGQLEKSVEVLKAKFEKAGYEVTTDSFRAGSADYGPSYVEMNIQKDYNTEEWAYLDLRFLAGGYGETSRDDVYGLTFTEMKQEVARRMIKKGIPTKGIFTANFLSKL